MPIYTPPIPICALTGETSSGKTLFPIMSTPNALDKSKPAQAVIHDLEGSAETYVHSLNFDWRDIRGMLASGLHMKTAKPADTDPNWKKILLTDTSHVNDNPGVSMFRAVYMSVMSIKPGEFLTCSIDPFTSLQMGCAEWLKLHPQAFHRTATQYIKAGSMFLIPDARQMLEYFLTVDCRSRFEMTVITFHCKNEWTGQGDGARKTGERISEHWELVDKVASLSATLDRRPKAKNKSAPRVPSGCIVYPYGKSRMMVVKDGQLLPALPPRIPEFTPEALRAYFESPPDYDKLKPEERMPADDMSDDERLRVQAGIAADQRMTAELQSTNAQVQQLGVSSQAAAIAATAPKESAQPATVTTPAPVDVSVSPITAKQTADIMGLVKDHLQPAGFAAMLKRYGVAKLSELSESRATDLHCELLKLDSERKQAAAAKSLGGNTSAAGDAMTKPPAVADPVIPAKRIPAIMAIAQVGNITPARFGELLAEVSGKAGTKVSELTTSQADALVKLIPTGSEVAKQEAEKAAAAKPAATLAPTQQPPTDVTPEQLETLKKLVMSTDWKRDKQEAYLKGLGYASFRSLKFDEAKDLIAKLESVEANQKAKTGN